MTIAPKSGRSRLLRSGLAAAVLLILVALAPATASANDDYRWTGYAVMTDTFDWEAWPADGNASRQEFTSTIHHNGETPVYVEDDGSENLRIRVENLSVIGVGGSVSSEQYNDPAPNGCTSIFSALGFNYPPVTTSVEFLLRPDGTIRYETYPQTDTLLTWTAQVESFGGQCDPPQRYEYLNTVRTETDTLELPYTIDALGRIQIHTTLNEVFPDYGTQFNSGPGGTVVYRRWQIDLTGVPKPPECGDGIDNDGDGKKDYPKDPGCHSVEDKDEINPDWIPILAQSQFYWQVAETFGPSTEGLYHQLFNLVCAASRSTIERCGPMALRGYVGSVGVPKDWSDDWVYLVFDDYFNIRDDGTKAINEVRAADRAAKLLKKGCEFVSSQALRKVCKNLRAKDVGTTVAGLIHYVKDLDPSFNRVTKRLLKEVEDGSAKAIRKVIKEIRYEHRSLFCNGVIPGFKAVAAAGEITEVYAQIAFLVVPPTAHEWRERAIRKALVSIHGWDRGWELYDHDPYKRC